MRIWLAIQVFFRTLLNREFADKMRQLGQVPGDVPSAAADAVPTPPRSQEAARRSDAITLLAALQREARFVDIIQEPLDGYSDAQIGAAARDILRDCGQVIERMFALQPVASQPEGSDIQLPAEYDTTRYRLTGAIAAGNTAGKLIHPGWQASRCELPQWSGAAAAALVVAPAEIKIG